MSFSASFVFSLALISHKVRKNLPLGWPLTFQYLKLCLIIYTKRRTSALFPLYSHRTAMAQRSVALAVLEVPCTHSGPGTISINPKAANCWSPGSRNAYHPESRKLKNILWILITCTEFSRTFSNWRTWSAYMVNWTQLDEPLLSICK